MSRPSWLPPPASISGPREEAVSSLYRIFSENFKHTGCSLRSLPVRWDGRILPGELYEEVFWHLISRKNKRTGERSFDARRAERLPWCKPLVSHADDDAVTSWRDRVRSRVRTFIWLREYDYVVVLEEASRRTGTFAFLITAYYVEGEATRRRLRKSHSRRLP